MATEVRINLREAVSKGINRIEERINQAIKNIERPMENLRTTERRVAIAREEFVRQAKIMAEQERIITTARDKIARFRSINLKKGSNLCL